MSRRRQRKSRLKTVLLIALIVLVVAGAGVFFGSKAYLASAAAPVNPGDSSLVAVTIQPGTSTRKIGEILEDEGLTKSAFMFRMIAQREGFDGQFKAGDYELSPSMTMNEIMELLTVGSMAETNRFTIPEGYTLEQAADKLASEGLVDKDIFMDELAHGDFDYKFMPALPDGPDRFLGFLFPETYDIYKDATEKDIINRMLSQFDKVFLDEYYTRATEMGMSVFDIITIAALIEGEAQVADEQPLVSSVIYNRLNINMQLQFCSTVQFALGEPKPRLSQSDLEIDSPYNTYIISGLPPGPISSPGAGAILAALYPADTDYIYFVLKPDGSGAHNFASNYSDFSRFRTQYLNSL